jgi:1-acyl-sn-glycerol-3-phosphate acyltransferase
MLKWIRLVFTGGPSLIIGSHHCKKFNRHKEKYPIEERCGYANRLAKKICRKCFRAEFIMKGEEYLKQVPGQALIVSNHVSNADPILFLGFADRPISFLGKQQILKMPFVGNILSSIDGSFIDREDLRSEIKVFHEIQNLLSREKNLSYVVFPEGTRSKGPEFKMADFKGGTFKIATRLNLPIIPVATWLNERTLDQHYHYHKYPIQITYCKPILPEEYEHMTTGQIAKIAEDRVKEALVEMKQKDLELVMKLNHYSEKKARKVQYSSNTKTI